MNIPDGFDRRIDAGYGPRPTPVGSTSAQRVSRAAAAVLDRLLSHAAPTTATELADGSGQHANTVREHLDSLVDAGLATRERAPAAGRGRPAWLYAAVPASEGGHTEYAGLATALAMQLARSSSHPQQEAEQAGEAWGAQLAATATAQSPNAAQARRQVVDILDGLGFAPESGRRSTSVRLRQCPMLEAAKQQPDVVCAVHLGIVRGALERWGAPSEGTSLVPFAEPGSCRLHLTAK